MYCMTKHKNDKKNQKEKRKKNNFKAKKSDQ